jgi:hypothetical protein
MKLEPDLLENVSSVLFAEASSYQLKLMHDSKKRLDCVFFSLGETKEMFQIDLARTTTAGLGKKAIRVARFFMVQAGKYIPNEHKLCIPNGGILYQMDIK